MSEKVIHQFQIIETDDGFRIEIKGDKEELRKMLFEQGRPFSMPFGRGRGFGFGEHRHGPFGHHHHEHGPFGHQHEHGQREHGQHGEQMRPPVEGRERHTPEEMHNQHFFFERHLGGRGWKAKRGGYDMGPLWDENAPPPDEETRATL